MLSLNDISMKPKLIGLFLAVGLIPLVLTALGAGYLSKDALLHEAFNQLVSVRDIKKAQLENSLAERRSDLKSLVKEVSNLQEVMFDKLKVVQALKKNSIEGLFAGIRGAVHVVKDDPGIAEAFEALNKAFIGSGETRAGYGALSCSFRHLHGRHPHLLPGLQARIGLYPAAIKPHLALT